MVLRLGFIIIGEDQQGSRQQEHTPHDEQSVAEDLFYGILKENTHDADRYHRHQDIDRKTGSLVHLSLGESAQDPHHLMPQHHQCAEHRSHMDHYGERQVIRVFYPKEIGSDSKMATTTYGQVFRKSLYQTKN